MKLISNKALRKFAAVHADAEQPLQDFRRLVEQGTNANFAQLKTTFANVDKVAERYVFNIGGNKYGLVCVIAFQPVWVWVKALLTHSEYDKRAWK